MTYVVLDCNHGDGFQCPDGRCIPSIFECNGVDDCGDFTDERDCRKIPNLAFFSKL